MIDQFVDFMKRLWDRSMGTGDGAGWALAAALAIGLVICIGSIVASIALISLVAGAFGALAAIVTALAIVALALRFFIKRGLQALEPAPDTDVKNVHGKEDAR